MAISIFSTPKARLAGLITGAILMLGFSAAISQETPPPVVLTINGETFTLNLVGNMANQLPDEMRRQPAEALYEGLIDDIIDTKLSADAARSSGLADNLAIREIAERARDRILAEVWLNEEIAARITDEMLQKSYNDLVADTESRTEVRARHILVDNRDAALAAIARLDQGEDFAALAKEISTGPSGPNGGELGYFRRGAMVPSFEVASFALAKDSYTKEPVQTQFGWHVIKVEDRRVAPAPTFETAQDQLRNTISVKLAGTILSELRENAEISRLSYEELRASQQAQ
ncbi:peptidylprolyl isomerase [Alphaproteobacteria bacterium LSUCC0684]